MENKTVTSVGEIPEAALKDIAFMLGDDDECALILSGILTKHGYGPENYGFLGEYDDEALTVDIYNTYYATGLITPFNEAQDLVES